MPRDQRFRDTRYGSWSGASKAPQVGLVSPTLAMDARRLNEAIAITDETVKAGRDNLAIRLSQQALRENDYKFQQRMEADSLYDESIGVFVENVSKIDPDHPDALKDFNKQFVDLDPRLYGHKDVVKIMGMYSGRIQEGDTRRKYERSQILPITKQLANLGVNLGETEEAQQLLLDSGVARTAGELKDLNEKFSKSVVAPKTNNRDADSAYQTLNSTPEGRVLLARAFQNAGIRQLKNAGMAYRALMQLAGHKNAFEMNAYDIYKTREQMAQFISGSATAIKAADITDEKNKEEYIKIQRNDLESSISRWESEMKAIKDDKSDSATRQRNKYLGSIKAAEQLRQGLNLRSQNSYTLAQTKEYFDNLKMVTRKDGNVQLVTKDSTSEAPTASNNTTLDPND
jgi:hypothetical protein